uniref:hypothetical protein n=1 Tax=Sphingobium sp. WCS2017Hpa-17 TaxID=3073638 RepID=UPI0028890AF3
MTDQKYMRPGLDFATGKLVEELGELLAALGKTMRWGRDSFNPELPPAAQEPNWHWIEREIDDVLGAIANYRKEAGTATPARTDDAAQAGGSVTQSDADAANAWMRDHLDGGNAPGSLC